MDGELLEQLGEERAPDTLSNLWWGGPLQQFALDEQVGLSP
jgi:hypothetical protein